MSNIPPAVRNGVCALATAHIAGGLYVWSDTAIWDAGTRMSPLGWVLFFAANSLYFVLLALVWRSHNWARWTIVILCAIQILATVSGLAFFHASSSLDLLVQSVLVAVQVWGCYMLLSKQTSTWLSASERSVAGSTKKEIVVAEKVFALSVLVAVLSFYALSYFMIPRFEAIIREMAMELPVATRVVFATYRYWPIFAVIGVIGLVLVWWRRNRSGWYFLALAGFSALVLLPISMWTMYALVLQLQ